jgi:hypothetical protein
VVIEQIKTIWIKTQLNNFFEYILKEKKHWNPSKKNDYDMNIFLGGHLMLFLWLTCVKQLFWGIGFWIYIFPHPIINEFF